MTPALTIAMAGTDWASLPDWTHTDVDAARGISEGWWHDDPVHADYWADTFEIDAGTAHGGRWERHMCGGCGAILVVLYGDVPADFYNERANHG